MTHTRARYQHGSLTKEERKSGPAVWIYRWRESFADASTVNRKKIVGTTEEYPNKTSALRAVDGLRLEINAITACSASKHTVAELATHYCETELGGECSKTALTRKVYLYHLKEVILPAWGDFQLHQVRSVAVERWLSALTGAPSTKAKTRNVFSTLYRHAMRYEWTTANPIQLVRQSAQRLREPDVLTVEELQALIGELDEPAKTFAITAAVTGLRCSEIIGLKWQDISFEEATIRVLRSLVGHVEGKPKTEASRRPIPLSPQLAKILQEWRTKSPFTRPVDWLFASPASLGQKPYWPGMILAKHLKPAAQRLDLTKRIGWHTFRRTYATLLPDIGASVTTTKELMRHANPSVTFSLYAQAVTEEKRTAQNALASRVIGTTAETGQTTCLCAVPIRSQACSHPELGIG